MKSHHLKFNTTKAFGGLAKIEGAITLHDDHLSFEMMMTESIAGAAKGIIQREIPLCEISDAILIEKYSENQK